jgi:hypothetical protein
MPLPNGAEEKIVDQGDAQRWDVYGKGVCYVIENPRGSALIECYDVDSRSVQRVATPEKVPFPLGFSVSRDGAWILYTRVDRNESDLMMVENFR